LPSTFWQPPERLPTSGEFVEPTGARADRTEIDLFGVYVAPMSLMLVAVWLVTVGLRRLAAGFGLLRRVWHPALFMSAVYMIVLSSIVLGFAQWGRYV
jgi:hypothetical protein